MLRFTIAAMAIAIPVDGHSIAQDREPEAPVAQVELCDLLTAHPSDKGRLSDGVADEDVVPGLSVPACERAVAERQGPLNDFQLGRAYFSAGRFAEAAELFIDAATKGHPVAAGYAGDAYLFGNGVERDIIKAREFYKQAIEGGFDASKEMLDATIFDGKLYMIPLVSGLYAGLDSLSEAMDLRKDPRINIYVFSFATSLNGSCAGAVKPPELLALMGLRYNDAGPVTAEVEASGDYQIYTGAGDYDAQTFVQRHSCDGPVTEQVINNLTKYIQMHKQ